MSVSRELRRQVRRDEPCLPATKRRDSNTVRAIDFHKRDTVDEAALKSLIRSRGVERVEGACALEKMTPAVAPPGLRSVEMQRLPLAAAG